MSKTCRLQLTKTLPASTERVWELVIRLETLQYIARPLLTFKPLDSLQDGVYQAGASCRFSLRLLGLFPLGMHRIHILKCDKGEGLIQSSEHGSLTRQWNHTIRVEPARDGQTLYTDSLEIEGVWGMTRLIGAFAWLFYRHRQRRWVGLLRKGEKN
jgi:ligand-binding SRPBCC domain-containing protein